MFKLFVDFLKALNANASPWQLAWGLNLGLVMGLTPLFGLHSLILLLLALSFRINISMFAVSAILYGMLGLILDPWLHSTGLSILNNPSLNELFTSWFNSDVMRLTRFNHTVMMAALTVSLIGFIPLLFAHYFLVRLYRTYVLPHVQRSRLLQILKLGTLSKVFVRGNS